MAADQPGVIPDFDSIVSASPGMSFLGPYNRHVDLPDIYREVHFQLGDGFLRDAGQFRLAAAGTGFTKDR